MRRVAFAAAMFCATPALADATGTWRGEYYCNGSATLELQLTEDANRAVSGRFDFEASGNRGSYEVRGRRAQDGALELRPGGWIEQPAGFVAVGMRGVVDGDTYSGEIVHDACLGFTAQRLTQEALAEARDLDPSTFEIISVPREFPPPPGIDASVLRRAQRIPTQHSAHFQPNPPNTPETAVYVSGRNKAYLVRPFVAYEVPMSGPELETRNFPYYTPRDTPELPNRAYLPYAGRESTVVSRQRDGSETSWVEYEYTSALPGLRYAYSNLYGPPDLWAVDGYFFRSHADLDHYLARQPAGRIVEYLFLSTGANRRDQIVFTVYAPLVGYSDQVRRQTAFMQENAPSMRTDVLANWIADATWPVINQIWENATRPPNLFEMLERAEENARRCREAGGIC